MSSSYVQYLDSLCKRRGWPQATYEYHGSLDELYTCIVHVNGQEYDHHLSWESREIAQENAAIHAFMMCRFFPARNGIVGSQPQYESTRMEDKSRAMPLSWRRGSYNFSESSSAGSTAVISSDAYKGDTASTSATVNSSHQADELDVLFAADGLTANGTPRQIYLAEEVGILMSNIAFLHSFDRQSLGKYDPKSPSPRDLDDAIMSHDYDYTRWLLDNSFDYVAVQHYSWLTELKQLGFSPLEITDELLEKAIHGAWIHEPFEAPLSEPSTPGFHQKHCVHSDQPKLGKLRNGAESLDSEGPSTQGDSVIVNETELSVQDEQIAQPGSQTFSRSTGSLSSSELQNKRVSLTARQRIEYFCGLGGVRPAADGIMDTNLGLVSFLESHWIANIMPNGPYPEGITRFTLDVLDNLDRAVGELQRLGGCCDSFTILLDWVSEDYIELRRIPLCTIHKLRQLARDLDRVGLTDLIVDLFGRLCPDPDYPHWLLLATQFLALGLLSSSQAHCGPIQPFFVDTPLKSISLLGSHGLYSSGISSTNRAALTCHLVEMTCMGKMVGQSVLAFDWFRSSAIQKSRIRERTPPKNLLASPEDILDTWGPGSMAVSADGSNMLYSVLVGGGTITSNGARTSSSTTTTPQLHWSNQILGHSETLRLFPRNIKALIGATIFENIACQSAPARLRESVPMLEEMSTFPSYWEVVERQLGLGIQGGQAAVAVLQFNQTWVKMMGATKKSVILSQRAVYIGDLENMFGVQVSICTGIARRVRLRDLLADLLTAYVSGLVVKPPLWDTLVNKSNVISALRESDLRQWLESLDSACRAEFEGLVFAMLYLLRDTGIDRKGDHFVVACVQSELPFQCFKIPCKKENYWSRMLIDSEDSATFAYVTTQCLETAALKCCRPSPSWSNSTALLGTAVSQDRMAATQAIATASAFSKWSLKDDEAYLIGRPDKALYVQVKRPTGSDPHLLVSLSTIPPEFLKRLFRKDKLKRLREKKCYDMYAESVVISVGKAGADSQT